MALNRRSFLRETMGGIAGLTVVSGGSVAASPGKAGPLLAGAYQADITPPLAMPLSGVIAQGSPSAHVHDPLNAKCLVLDNGSHKLAFAVCDVRMISREICDAAKKMASQHTGIPLSQILISATHTHSAPTPIGVIDSPLRWPRQNPEMLKAYEIFLSQRIADGIRCAYNNLTSAEIGWGKGMAPQHVFNRRWFVKSESIQKDPFGQLGDKVRMNPPAGTPDLIEPAGPTDPEVSVLVVRRRDRTPICVLANYSLHYVGGIPGGNISADYFGAFGRELIAMLGACNQNPPFVGIMSNGTSGDINNINFRKERKRREPYSQMYKVAADVAAEVARTVGEIEFRDRVVLDSRERLMSLGVRLPSAPEVRWAKETLESFTDDGRRPTRPEIYARETLFMSARAPVKETVVQAFRIGDLGIGALACEVFAETGLAIKEQSPLSQTFTIELANDYAGYLPTSRQHQLGGYETWRARSSFLEIEAASKLSNQLVELFGEMS